MSKYIVLVFETKVYEYEVEADGEDSASEVAQLAYDDDDTTYLLRTWKERNDSYPYVRGIA